MTEILFLTHNRREYAERAWAAMLRNTDWSKVDKLWLFDDRSGQDTKDLLYSWMRATPRQVTVEIVFGCWNSPVTAMADFFHRANERGRSLYVAKIDSDVMLPPGWLGDCLDVLEAQPEINLLGIEARIDSGYPFAPTGTPRRAEPADWIGGIGVFRRSAFVDCELPTRDQLAPAGSRKFYGWQSWQTRFPDRARAAWLNPAMQVFLLDRLPLEPWRTLGQQYVRRGWQRAAPYYYGAEWAHLWSWADEFLKVDPNV